jgi:hypothetical protein
MRNNYPPSTPQQYLQAQIGRLPASARRKYRTFCTEAEDAANATAVALQRERQLEDRLADLARRLGTFDPGDPTAADDIADLKAAIEEAQSDYDNTRSERDRRNAIKAGCDQVIAQLRDRFLPALVFPVREVLTVISDSETNLVEAIERTRQAIIIRRSELARVKALPPDAAEIRQQLRRHVEDKCRAGMPTVALGDPDKVSVHWADTVQHGAPGTAFVTPASAASNLLCWLFPQQVFDRLCEWVDDNSEGITAADRKQRIADCENSIRQLEVQEESLVVAALKAGLAVQRHLTRVHGLCSASKAAW